MPEDTPQKGDDAVLQSPERAFAETFRAALLNRTASLLSDQSEELIAGVVHELEARAAANDSGLLRLKSLIGAVAGARVPGMLGVLVKEYFATAYELFQQSRSAVAFYCLSEELLREVTTAIVEHAVAGLDVPDGKTPTVMVITLGPGGRHEFSPFCRVQLLLVHEHIAPSQAEALGRRVHDAFEETGLFPDELISPRNAEWRGTPAEWLTRLDNGLKHGDGQELIQLLRLADQTVLYDNNGAGNDFREECIRLLRPSRSALHNLVGRIGALSSGTALIGGVRVSRSGPHAGTFNLLDHALLPFSACVTALSLMRGVKARGTYHRIGELNDSGGLGPDMAVKLRETWHLINELRLLTEARKQPQWSSEEVLWLSITACESEQQQRLADCLKAVSKLQRYVRSCFNCWEEPEQC